MIGVGKRERRVRERVRSGRAGGPGERLRRQCRLPGIGRIRSGQAASEERACPCLEGACPEGTEPGDRDVERRPGLLGLRERGPSFSERCEPLCPVIVLPACGETDGAGIRRSELAARTWPRERERGTPDLGQPRHAEPFGGRDRRLRLACPGRIARQQPGDRGAERAGDSERRRVGRRIRRFLQQRSRVAHAPGDQRGEPGREHLADARAG